MPNDRPLVTRDDTITALLDRGKRDHLPIRKTFVQQGTGRVRDPGPIASLCSHRDERGLDLYLLFHAAASSEPYDVALSALTWARVLGLGSTPSSRSAVSKAFTRLVDLRLVERAQRAGRHSRIVLLDEGGHGAAYEHPAKSRDRYLKLPRAYWDEQWYSRLTLPGKVVLLIALSLDDEFPLPIKRAPDWYGISSDTVQRGLTELVGAGILRMEERYKKAPLSPEGFTQDRRYTLERPFGPQRGSLASLIQLNAS